MRPVIFTILLLGLSACGGKDHSRSKTEKSEERFTITESCAIPTSFRGIFTPKILISPALMEKVEKNFQGRPFNRNAFWRILERNTRYELNKELQYQGKIPEELRYQGAVLFFENYFSSGETSFHLRTKDYHAIFAVRDTTKLPEPNCEDQDDILSEIDISQLINSETRTETLSCTVKTFSGKEDVIFRFYQNHLTFHQGEKTVLYTGGEIICDYHAGEVRIRAMDPEQNFLELTLTPTEETNKRNLKIRYHGKTRSLEGSGNCLILKR